MCPFLKNNQRKSNGRGARRNGDPETAFAEAEHRISITTNYPRNSATPIECFVVIAEYFPGEEAYQEPAFSGPHPMWTSGAGRSSRNVWAGECAR
jgi:hypothetical protein